MVAKHQHGRLFYRFTSAGVCLVGKDVPSLLGLDPIDAVFWLVYFRHVVRQVTGFRASFSHFFLEALFQVDDHGQLAGGSLAFALVRATAESQQGEPTAETHCRTTGLF